MKSKNTKDSDSPEKSSAGSTKGRVRAILRLALVGDDAAMRIAVQKAILDQESCCWELQAYLTPGQAFSSIVAAPPDVMLTDVFKLDFSGITIARKLKLLLPRLRVLMLSSVSDAHSILLSLMAGASGYVIKPVSASFLLEAAELVAQGSCRLCPRAEAAIVQFFQRNGSSGSFSELSSRESQVLACLFEDFADKEIADVMRIRVGTVRVHLANLFRKLEVHNRHEAVQRFLLMR